MEDAFYYNKNMHKTFARQIHRATQETLELGKHGIRDLYHQNCSAITLGHYGSVFYGTKHGTYLERQFVDLPQKMIQWKYLADQLSFLTTIHDPLSPEFVYEHDNEGKPWAKALMEQKEEDNRILRIEAQE